MYPNILEMLEKLFYKVYVIFSTNYFTLQLSDELIFSFSIWELIVFDISFTCICFVLAFFLRRG